ncbi:MAG TPA: DUF1080 domain-containing protein, partial [Pirellulaceae bacterium]|nr:DUF1080 domain-containing protein [Pirellulaceae bacterium]
AQAHAADGKSETFTDAEKAGVDYTLQGEYAGQLKGENGDEKWGAQVIALGGGKFHAIGYKGGLPGDGWKREDEKHESDGELKDGAVVFKKEDQLATLKDGAISVKVGDKELGTLKKVERKSPTLGAKPPEGALVLFDGSNVDQWNNGQMTEDKLLKATNVETKEKFNDHTLHIEFRTPFMPVARGQGRGNSGVYMQSRYELQVLDSFGLDGADNECGGIYSINKPLVNACLPPLAWQTYDIEFKAAKYDAAGKKTENGRATIKHNGIVIHDNLELKHGTPGRHNEGPTPDAIFLQDHGNPVVYRNIWIIKQ